MSNSSTWYVDGYNDAISNAKQATLHPLKSRVHGKSNINQIEYNEGYADGKKDIAYGNIDK
jgi:hypothetical protein